MRGDDESAMPVPAPHLLAAPEAARQHGRSSACGKREVALNRREVRGLSRLSHNALGAFLFLLPFLVPYVVLKLWPIVYGFWISLHNWSSIGGDPTFVGAQNYQRLFYDPLFWRAFSNTLLFTALATPTLIALGMGLALILNRALPGGGAFRTLFYLPNMLSVSVISLIFVAVLTADNSGLVNNLMGNFGIAPIPFLLNQHTAMPSLALAAVWWTVGFNMLILLAGLQNIPREILDAARVDGANRWQQFVSITLPLLRRPLMLVTILQVIACFQVFGLVDVMTRGGPGGATRSLVYYLFERAFSNSQLGYGSAIAMILFLILFVVSMSQLRFFRRQEDAA
jgi:ABC-type sugar transport system permease subunit